VDFLGRSTALSLAVMNAGQLGFPDGTFDLTLCLQNGISAFRIHPKQLLAEAVRVTRCGGTVLCSTYSAGFWKDRLNWFRIQAEHGLIGDIDEEATGDGVIVCRTAFAPRRLLLRSPAGRFAAVGEPSLA
jgi:SAM-dependent methyltransferase